MPLFRSLTRRKPNQPLPLPLLLPLSSTYTTSPPRRFHATATNLRPTTTPVPPFAKAFQAERIYTDHFPCTLHYYSSRGPKLALFDYTTLFAGVIEKYSDFANYPYYIHEDSVFVGNNGLVDPTDRSQSNLNGLNMWPNTLLMLQITRSYSEAADDFRAGGEDVPIPWIFTITKGNQSLSPSVSHGWAFFQRKFGLT